MNKGITMYIIHLVISYKKKSSDKMRKTIKINSDLCPCSRRFVTR